MKRFLLFVSILLVASCGTAKLQEGQYALRKSKVVLSKEAKDAGLKTNDIAHYVRTADIYDKNIQPSSESNIVSHLNYLGYYGSKVSSSVKFKKKKARITYAVVPGQRIVIDSINYILPENEEFKKLFLAGIPSVSVRPGDYLSEKSLAEESERCAKYFRNYGYYSVNSRNFSFVADTLNEARKLILDYVLDAKTDIYTIGDITVSYPENLKFRDKVFKGIVSLKSGEQYSDNSVNKAYNRLSALKVFNGVNIEMVPRDSMNVVDCRISMTPSQLQGFKINLEASTNSNGLIGISPQINYYHNNIFHGGEKLTLGFKGDFQFKVADTAHSEEYGIQAAIKLPKFLGIKYKDFKGSNIPSTDFSLSFSYQNRPEYTRTIFSFSYGYSGSTKRKANNYLSYQLNPISINAVKLFNMSDDFLAELVKNPLLWYSYTDHINAGLIGSMYWSNSSQAIPKTSFRYLRASVGLSGNLLSAFNFLMPVDEIGQRTIFGLPYSQYAKGEVQLGETWRFGKKDNFAIAARLLVGAGQAYGNSTTMPFEEQFYCGGANSMRGWQARTLGPGSEAMIETFSIPAQAGDMKLEADIEFRFPIFWKMEGALFAETGNVWLLPNSTGYTDDVSYFSFKTFAKQLAGDWGIGLRFNFDFLLIRFDFGMKVYDPAREEGSRWLNPVQWFDKYGCAFHFGVGYPF